MKTMRTAIVAAVIAVSILLLASCGFFTGFDAKSPSPPVASPSPTADNNGAKLSENTDVSPVTQSSESSGVPSGRAWKGSGYRYTSDTLGITVEFPPEWKGLLDIYESKGESPMGTGISLDQAHLPTDPEPKDNDFTWNVGWIGFAAAKDKQVLLDWNNWQEIPKDILHDGDDGFVYIAYSHIPGPQNGKYSEQHKMIRDGIKNGEYEIYIETEGHPWKGSGYKYTSDTLGITVEFPPEWEGLLNISEFKGGFLMEQGIGLEQAHRPTDPEPKDNEFTWDIGWIGYAGAKDKQALLASNDWENTPHGILHDGDDGFVYIYFPHTPAYNWSEEQIKDDPQVSKYISQREMMRAGLDSGEYEVYIKTQGHPWKGSGYKYTSDTLGITVEFPPEWKGLLDIYESKGESPMGTGISLDQAHLPTDPEPKDNDFTWNVGWIGFAAAKDKQVLLDWNNWQEIPKDILHDGDDGFVYIAYSHIPGPQNGKYSEQHKMILEGIKNGDYEVYIG